jgi:hypothetical protein
MMVDPGGHVWDLSPRSGLSEPYSARSGNGEILSDENHDKAFGWTSRHDAAAMTTAASPVVVSAHERVDPLTK